MPKKFTLYTKITIRKSNGEKFPDRLGRKSFATKQQAEVFYAGALTRNSARYIGEVK